MTPQVPILPADWQEARLGDFFQITKKPRNLKLAEQPRIAFVPMDRVPLGGALDLRWEERSPEEVSSGTYFERGDILLAKITPSFQNGKQGLADNLETAFGVASTEVIPIQEIRGKSNRYFLFYYLLHPEVRASMTGKMEGSTGRQRVPVSVVLDWMMALPPLPEQKKIAAVLRKVQEAVEVEAALARNARDLKKSLMRRLFTRGLHDEPVKETEIGPVPESWEVVPLSTMGKIGNGSTPKRGTNEFWEGGDIPWLTSGKIHESQITEADQFVTRVAVKKCHLPFAPKHSLFVAITGQGKTLGNAAITKFETTMSQHLAYVRPDNPEMDPFFVLHFLQSRYLELHSIGKSGGSTKGALTCGFLKGYLVPKPPIADQEQVARILGVVDEKIAVHEAKRDAYRALFKTLLHKLMTAQIRVHELEIDTAEVVP